MSDKDTVAGGAATAIEVPSVNHEEEEEEEKRGEGEGEPLPEIFAGEKPREIKDEEKQEDVGEGQHPGPGLELKEDPEPNLERDNEEGEDNYLVPPPSKALPEVLRVVISDEDGGPASHEVYLQIEKISGKKPYLGGYRHALTQVVYHHASTQFGTVERKQRDVTNLRTRETQTYEAKTRSSQTYQECGTQMSRKDLLISTDGDKVLMSSPHFISSEEFWKERERCIVRMQCFWRGCRARKKMNRIKRRIAHRSRLREEEKEREVFEEQRRADDMERIRTHPRTASDFKALYKEVETWRREEDTNLQSVSTSRKEFSMKGSQILTQETRALQTIERLKREALKSSKQEKIDKRLQAMSAPKHWSLTNGKEAEVHTQWTTRAAELREIYNALETPSSSREIDERLNILLNVKWTIKEFNCSLTQELAELLDREADLLHRGRSERSLKGLRERISNLFLLFISCPEFNPEAAQYLKIPTRSHVQDVPIMSA